VPYRAAYERAKKRSTGATGRMANIVIALAARAVPSAFYLWHRDLVANMIGHFAVDFVGVILSRLLHHS
jgi:hypothetical protein